jgi:hypothetical protein
MKDFANILIDRVEEDYKSGVIKVNKKGEILRNGHVIGKK